MNGPLDAPPGFQWDEAKNRINIQKHGINFKDAVRIFEKPTLDQIDERENYNEERTNSLGELDGRVILNVTHTERNGDIRLISARLAKSAEREIYREFVRDLGLLSPRSVVEKLLEAGSEYARTKPNPTPEPKLDPTPSTWPDYSKGMKPQRKKPTGEDEG